MGGERHPVRGFTSQYILLRSWCLDALLISLFAGAKWRESNESEKATRKGEMILVIAKDCEWVITNHMWCAPSTYAWYMWWIYLHFAQFWLVKWITSNMSKFLIAYGYSSPKHLFFFQNLPKQKGEEKKNTTHSPHEVFHASKVIAATWWSLRRISGCRKRGKVG